ncbi:type I restriction enzyme S subunit [Streptomyces sp. 840.1]|uniref:restriction endonuclease subunit S n=1 Tax=Streptomyces sp. 840.1 TaxID=2485152 RepID=UPI000F4A35F9|nr:restriction endonuclease subunit S [Streptomyces sp. 840.1]ROQ67895.1 type I restriction enzyme S subunit [Streptomyces sp. 840.1]
MSAESDEIRWVPVREVGEVRMGKQLSPASSQADGMHGPYLRVANVLDGRISYADVKTMSFTPLERHKYNLLPGDILLNEGQSLELVGRSSIYDGPPDRYFFQNTLIRFRCGPEVLPAYAREVFRAWVNDGTFASIAKKTTSIAHLGGDRFARLSFPLVSMSRQRRIIEILDAVTDSERITEEEISKLRATRQAAIDGQISASGRSISLSGYTLGIQSGWSPACNQRPPGPSEWGVVRVSAVTQGIFRPEESKRLPDSLDPRENLEIHPGDLLMARANGAKSLVGVTALVGETRRKLMLSDKTFRIIPSPSCSGAEFLHVLLGASIVRAQIDSLLSGSTGQANISQAAVMSLRVPKFELLQQAGFVALSVNYAELIKSRMDGLRKLRQVGDGIISEFLTTRVPG